MNRVFELIHENKTSEIYEIISNYEKRRRGDGRDKRRFFGRDGEGNTLLHAACAKGMAGIAKKCISLGMSLDDRNQRGETPLMQSIRGGHWHCFEAMLEAGCEIDAVNCYRQTSVIKCVLYWHNDMLKELVRRGADTQIEDVYGWRATDYAKLKGNLVAMQLLEPRQISVKPSVSSRQAA